MNPWLLVGPIYYQCMLSLHQFKLYPQHPQWPNALFDGLLLGLTTWPLDLWAMTAEHEGVEGRRQENVRIVGPREKGVVGRGVLVPKLYNSENFTYCKNLDIMHSFHGKFTGSIWAIYTKKTYVGYVGESTDLIHHAWNTLVSTRFLMLDVAIHHTRVGFLSVYGIFSIYDIIAFLCSLEKICYKTQKLKPCLLSQSLMLFLSPWQPFSGSYRPLNTCGPLASRCYKNAEKNTFRVSQIRLLFDEGCIHVVD